MYNNWVMDVTNWPVYCFMPVDGQDIIFGVNLISDKCPCNLVGIIHSDGLEFAEAWAQENYDWFEKYSSEKED